MNQHETKSLFFLGALGIPAYLGFLYIGAGWNALDGHLKPFAYRQLVPTLSWAFERMFNSSEETGTKLVILLFSILMGWGAWNFHTSIFHGEKHPAMYVILLSCITFFLASFSRHNYDIPTVALTVCALALLKKQKIDAYCFLFPILCYNRETSIILIVFFAAYFYNKLSLKTIFILTIYQLLVYISIRIFIYAQVYAYPGDMFQAYYQLYLTQYNSLAATVIIGLLYVAWLRAKWSITPYVLKIGVLTFSPILWIGYMLFGYPLELRVFLEVVPILVLIGVYDGS
jgi:hypothetical protein